MQLAILTQLFFKKTKERTFIIAVQVVDGIMFIGDQEKLRNVIEKIKQRHKRGIIVYGLGIFLFYYLTITQAKELNVRIDGDHKMELYAEPTISWSRRK